MKTAHNRVDRVGLRYGRLFVNSYAYTERKKACWNCICDCGKETVVDGSSLQQGFTQSCGCIKREQTVARNFRHGLRHHPKYLTWLDMHLRCYNEDAEWFHDYGGRGIFICPEWHDLRTFLAWCDEQKPPKGYSIDRRDNDGPYSPDNCHFITPHAQNRNMRSNVWVEWSGGRMILKDFVAAHGVVSYDVAKIRVRKHDWNPYEAATTPGLGRGHSYGGNK